jgi:hypothetical protein
MANVITNAGTDGWLVEAPAFSVTKVQATMGTLIAAILGAVPASLQADRTVVIACLAAATLLLLGILALVAVDIQTRQRAQEAQACCGAAAAPADLVAVPAERVRILRGGSDDEYELDLVKVTGDAVRMIATRAGETITVSFNIPTTSG